MLHRGIITVYSENNTREATYVQTEGKMGRFHETIVAVENH
jgi:hypothetical protein